VAQFQAFAEEISGQDLRDLFTTWLFTPGRPDLGGVSALAVRTVPAQPKSWQKIEQAHEALHR
jgi:hypothetical protein